MQVEIYWTDDGDEELGLLPGEVTQVLDVDGETRVFFAGRSTEYGDRYQGVLRIPRRTGEQTLKDQMTYTLVDGSLDQVPFSVVGSFKNRRFDSFAGTWFERGKGFRVNLTGLPRFAAKSRTKGRSKASRHTRNK
jgi:hypothetical protein